MSGELLFVTSVGGPRLVAVQERVVKTTAP